MSISFNFAYNKFIFNFRCLLIVDVIVDDSKRLFYFDAKSPHVAASTDISRVCSFGLICARLRSGACTGDRIS